MQELLNHLKGVLEEIKNRNTSIAQDLTNDFALKSKLLAFVQQEARIEDAEMEKTKLIQEINEILNNICGNVYHSAPLATRLENIIKVVEDMVGGGEEDE